MWRLLVLFCVLLPWQATAGSVSWHIAPVNGSNYLPPGEKRLYRLTVLNGTNQAIRLSDVTVIAHQWVGYQNTPHNSASVSYGDASGMANACIVFDPLSIFSPPWPPYCSSISLSFVARDAVDVLNSGASISCSFEFLGISDAQEYRQDFALIIPPANYENPADEKSITLYGIQPPVVVPAFNAYIVFLMALGSLLFGVFFMRKQRDFACNERTS